MAINLSYPKARTLQTKFIQIARTDTTAAIMAWLPKDAMLVGAFVIGHTASDAATTATLDVGTTSTATELIASYDVKTAATGEGFSAVGAAAVGSAFATRLTADKPVYAKYTESGTASTTGGPWTVCLDYFVPGPGELVDD